MIRKFFSAALLLLVTFAVARADEGMWLPDHIGQRIKDMQSKGLKLSVDDIYSVNQPSLKDAVVLFGGGCTGELVSNSGLLLTNHHCGYGQIQRHSSVEHDYLTNGFWAMNRGEELPCPGLTVTFLERMEDVTDRVKSGESAAAIVEQASDGGKYRCSVDSFYYDNTYYLFVYKIYRDVRLVAAPPSGIGKFGGDTDNWMWPRHTGDFSVFRIYADHDNQPADYSTDNVPFVPKKFFSVSTKGVAEGDFTFIYGCPGTTQRYVTSDAVDYVLNRSNPAKIKLRTIRLDIIDEAQQRDPATRIKYASKHANIANAWKKWQGESLGLKRLGTVDKKRAFEADFALWAADRPQYAHLLDSLHSAYAEIVEPYFVKEYFNESINAIELMRAASNLFSAISVGRERAVATAQSFYKDYDPQIDRAIAVRMIDEYMTDLKDYVPSKLKDMIFAYGSTQKYVDYIFDNSVCTALESYVEALDSNFESDPAVELLMMFSTMPQLAIRTGRSISDYPSVRRWYTPYMQALMEFDTTTPLFPDANLTLRVAYGKVSGYEAADAVYHCPFTTLDGIIEKDDPAIYDYDIPQQLRDCYANRDYGRWAINTGTKRNPHLTVPVAFIATNHTTGGNSGSPVLNARGELLGINFDRTWLSTMSDYEFDPQICRNISVDIRYVLFVIDKVGGARWLIDEMDLK